MVWQLQYLCWDALIWPYEAVMGLEVLGQLLLSPDSTVLGAYSGTGAVCCRQSDVPANPG